MIPRMAICLAQEMLILRLRIIHYICLLKGPLALGTGISEEKEKLPEHFVLYQNYPNPFNSETIIRYQLRAGSRVKIDIFNVLGQKITTLVNKIQGAGIYSVKWDGRNDRNNLVASGLYLYRFETDYKVFSKKMMFVK